MRKLFICAAIIMLVAMTFAAVLFRGRLLNKYETNDDYNEWADDTGYERGMLTPLGVDGIGQDYFHTLDTSDGYDSGRIVIGDSRCCQLGIYQQRADRKDFAVFAVWGGHYADNTLTPILTDEHLEDIEKCFKNQISVCDSCVIYLFATVNDYDFETNDNEDSIASAIAAAEKLSSLRCEKNGKTYSPQVIAVGFDGGRTSGNVFGIPNEDFNRYVNSYNDKLLSAVHNSELLKENAQYFTTVPMITGNKTTFIADGLHYSDETLMMISDYIKNSTK